MSRGTPARTPMWRPLLCAVGLLAAVLPACVAAAPRELTVSAAASLTNAFQDIGAAFSRARADDDVRVVFNFGASGALVAQLRQGAPVDVLATADQDTMDRALAARLVEGASRADFAGNTLVLVTPAQAPQPLPSALAELAAPGWRRIAVGTAASVPAGRYAVDALEAAGLAGSVGPKLVFGESVRQVLSYVARGEADAGFVYRTDALADAGKVRVALAVATRSPVRYPIAQVAGSRAPALARDFIAYVQGPEGRGILARHGFTPP